MCSCLSFISISLCLFVPLYLFLYVRVYLFKNVYLYLAVDQYSCFRKLPSSRENNIIIHESFAIPSPSPFICSVRSGTIVVVVIMFAPRIAAAHLRAVHSVKCKLSSGICNTECITPCKNMFLNPTYLYFMFLSICIYFYKLIHKDNPFPRYRVPHLSPSNSGFFLSFYLPFHF